MGVKIIYIFHRVLRSDVVVVAEGFLVQGPDRLGVVVLWSLERVAILRFLLEMKFQNYPNQKSFRTAP